MEEQRKQQASLILKYAKRRFDGGSEVEIIRNIERQHVLTQMNRMYRPSELHMETAEATSVAGKGAAAVCDQAAPDASGHAVTPDVAELGPERPRFLQALILGPMGLCIGTVGILTAALAIFTFKRLNNEALLRQSQVLWRDCLSTLRKGVVDTVTTPWRVLQVARG